MPHRVKGLTGVTDLVVKPALLYAGINRYQNGDNVLSIYHSPLVEWTDDSFAPVLDTLGQVCNVARSHRIEKNPNMMFGQGVDVEYMLYPVCPGNEVKHDCAMRDKEKICQTTT